MLALSPLAAPVDLNQPGHYVHWGVVQISVANLVVIGIMIVLFVAALLLPVPKPKDQRLPRRPPPATGPVGCAAVPLTASRRTSCFRSDSRSTSSRGST